MGIFLSRHINTVAFLRTKLLFVTILLASIIGVVLSSATVFAADAEFTTSEKTSILYQGKAYNGPNTNEEKLGTPTGWKPSNKDGDTYGVKYYIQEGNGSVIIWFETGNNNAHWSEIDAPNGQPRQYWKLKNTKNITVSVNRTDAAKNAMKSVFKNNVMSYANSICSKAPFAGNSNAQRECRDTISSKFDSCWSQSSFTVSDGNKPAEKVPVDDIAKCLAETKIGKAVDYKEVLNDARDEANTEGAGAYNSAIPEGEGSEDDTGNSCAIDGIGWIVCPLSTAAAAITDNVYKLVSELLEVKTLSNTSSNAALRNGWGTMLNIANVAFVIAFIVIIYSQITGGGFTNYAIKKMLPRLIVSAILVNISFWICAIAVDISNILGSSLQDMLINMRKSIEADNTSVPTWEAVVTNIISGGAIAAGVIGIATMSLATMWGLLGILWPLLIGVLFSVLVVLVVLTARQALIIILIIISPLAFVAFLLPNTEKWFTRWRDLFATMLFLFPIISLVFGGSQYAAALIMATSPSAAVIIMALAVQMLPLAITPMVLKFSGGLLGKIGGMVNNPTKGPFDRLKNAGAKRIERRKDIYGGERTSRNLERAQNVLKGSGGKMGHEYSRKRRFAAAVLSRGKTGDINLDKRKAFAEGGADEAATAYFAQRVKDSAKKGAPDNGAFIRNITGGDDERAATALQASAQSAMNKIESQDKESRAILFRAKIDPSKLSEFAKEWKEAVESGDIASARAAADIMMTSGSKGIATYSQAWRELEATENGSAILGDKTAGSLSSNLRQDINAKGLKGKDNALASIAFDGKNRTLTTIANDPDTYSGLTPTELIGQSPENMQVAAQTMSKEYAQGILNNPNIMKDLAQDKAKIIQMVANGEKVPMPKRAGGENIEVASTSTSAATQTTPTTPAATGSNRETVEQALKQAAEGTAGTQPFVVNSQGATELKIDHSEAPTQPIPTTTQPSATQAAPAASSNFEDIVTKGGWTPAAAPSATQAAPAQSTPSATQQTVNQTINQTNQQTVNETNNWAPSPATGRRSSGTPFDQPSNSTSEGITGRRRAQAPQPPQDSSSSFLPPNQGTGPSDIPDWFNK